ncbi:MAG: peptidoglycan-binding protein [Actinobacteria bacterium]|nr:peptidoglycan-binding protein [Actinomycetota bacterium]
MALEYLARSYGVGVSTDGSLSPSEVAGAESRVLELGGSGPDGRISAGDWAILVSHRPAFPSLPTPWGQVPLPDSVRAVEELLSAKATPDGACPGLMADGWFSAAEEDCVRAFQAEVALPATGFVDVETWKRLLWHYEPLWSNGTDLVWNGCRGASDDGSWMSSSARATIATGAALTGFFLQTPVAWTDASDEHGGKQETYHSTHRFGMGIDVRPINVDRSQCSTAVDMRHDTQNGSTSDCLFSGTADPNLALSSSYDQMATRTMLWSIVAGADSGRYIGRIFFNDCATNTFLTQQFTVLQIPSTNTAAKVKALEAHHNHAHISFCEPAPEFVDPGTGYAAANNTCRWS